MATLEPLVHWSIPEPHPLADDVIADARARGLSARLLRVLSRRGPVDAGTLAARFDPPESALLDPRLLPDADIVRSRVETAIATRERVLVLGDFDADGLTGLAILVLALRYLGLDVEPYVPARTEEGHGLSEGAVERARQGGRTLILTADTGSTSHAQIASAGRSGISVIVTDHHQLPGGPPDACAVVNPHRADSGYPDTRLSGAGVAFKVAQLLLMGTPDGAAHALGLADLAAIGSIADVVPLEGENRAIARIGLGLLAEGRRPGLAALLRSAGVAPERVSPETVSFALAPRINALGRVGHALDAALLLLEDDPARIEELVARMEAANLERRGLMTAALAEARDVLGPDDGAPITIVAGPWAPGVVGLVAGRLADQLGRPAVVFSTTVSPWRGSARSAGGFDLGAAFAANDRLFERHGGHAAAAGCHLDPERYGEFREAMLARFGGITVIPDRRRTLVLDLVVSGGSVDHVLLAELRPLDGVGDEPPLLAIAGLSVARVRSANGGHTQMTLRKGVEVLDGICFGRSDLVDLLHEGDVVDVAARLMSRRFAGIETLQLEVRDVAPGGHIAAMRAIASHPAGATVHVSGAGEMAR